MNSLINPLNHLCAFFCLLCLALPQPVFAALTAQYFDIEAVSNIDQIDFDATPIHTEEVVQINQFAANGAFYEGGKTDNFAVQYRGEFQVAQAGDYTFYLSSDDGSELTIDGSVAIDNDGLHSNVEKSAILALTQGTHQIQVRYFDRAEHATLSLAWQSTGFQRQIMTFNGAEPIRHAFTSGGDMQIVAHQDDDLLFMNPDIANSITADKPLTTVYITAGDAALGETYWRSRESGEKAAYAYMAGVDGWVDDRISVAKNGKTYELAVAYLLGKPYIQLVFLRLPDGFRNGNGSGANNGESLQKLYQYNINSIGALDGSNRYSRDDLINVIQGLLDAYQPLNVRIQDHESQHANNEHSDHVYTATFAADAARDNDAGLYLKSYINYDTENMAVNLSASEINLTRDTFLKYAAFDGNVWQQNGQLIDAYSAWVQRQYLAYEVEINAHLIGTNKPPIITLNQPQTSIGNAAGSIEAVASDADGTVSKIAFYYNGDNLIDTLTAAPYILNWAEVPDGTYNLTAKATDNDGLETTSNAVTVVVNNSLNTAPTVTLNPAEGSAGNVSGSITAVANDTDGSISKVEIYYNGGNLLDTITQAPYTVNWAGAPDGTYELTARAYDDAGGVTTSNVVTVKVNSALE